MSGVKEDHMVDTGVITFNIRFHYMTARSKMTKDIPHRLLGPAMSHHMNTDRGYQSFQVAGHYNGHGLEYQRVFSVQAF
jgi:hypothetical protein